MIFEFIVIFILLFIIIGLVYQFMYDIYTTVLMLIIVFYISYITVKLVYYYKRKKIINGNITTPEQKIPIKIDTNKDLIEKPKEIDKNIITLRNFISKSLKEGFKPQIIKNALLKQGWPKEKVEQAFSDIK